MKFLNTIGLICYFYTMEHTISTSADGSSTLKLKNFNESYHSTNGAYSEAMHIYIHNGLEYLLGSNNGTETSNHSIHVYDIGLGTGLNCLLSMLWLQNRPDTAAIYYHGIEKYPIPLDEIRQLNFPDYVAQQISQNTTDRNIGEEIQQLFLKIHEAPWEEDIELLPNFTLHKSKTDITDFIPESSAVPAIIFYDTFSPDTQPELWDESIFRQLYNQIPTGSALVTYCSKGTVKQALRNAGFIVRRLHGANGKRHMVRASK
ncbi:MAG: tRNA (5-methylaminomethyl-2-thiouridine)(34)-methyltransferase MnmD [Bacteroidales bacterium]